MLYDRLSINISYLILSNNKYMYNGYINYITICIVIYL